MPIFFAISGINFPIGVLIYWLTTNVWTMGQQFYVIRNMPAPGSEAEARRRKRLERKGKTMQELVRCPASRRTPRRCPTTPPSPASGSSPRARRGPRPRRPRAGADLRPAAPILPEGR